MKKNNIIMCDLGLGANNTGIAFGYENLKQLKPELAQEIDYIKFPYLQEDFSKFNKKYYNTIYNTCNLVYEASLEIHKQQQRPLLIGGDHSLALGSVKASMMQSNEDIGLIWIDAHSDINTFEVTNSGHIHGMPVANLLGINETKFNDLGNTKRIKAENLVLIGTRDVEEAEHNLINKHQIMNIDFYSIMETSLEEQVSRMINHLKGKVNKIHISFDLDSINPLLIAGVSTPVAQGLNLEQPLYIIDQINENFEIIAIDLVEYNPLYDTDFSTLEYVSEVINKLKNI